MLYNRFPEIEPFNTFRLKVSEIHELYIEECGNPQGKPILFLHGGPGAGFSEKHRRYFDPKFYRIILFDQRGAGKSTPHAELKENTTWDLVSDIEKIRTHLEISKWFVFGGSWGSTLALAYAEAHPESVMGLVLRGIFLCRKEELYWFYQYGAHLIFPEFWEDYLKVIPESGRDNLLHAYYRKLTSQSHQEQMEAAKAWSTWEGSMIKLVPQPDVISEFGDGHMSLSLARIEAHYFINKCWFKTDNQLIENIYKIKHLPAIIIHGRYDMVCPFKNAWDLHKAWPEAKFQPIAVAGHAVDEEGIVDALIRATESFKNIS